MLAISQQEIPQLVMQSKGNAVHLRHDSPSTNSKPLNPFPKFSRFCSSKMNVCKTGLH